MNEGAPGGSEGETGTAYRETALSVPSARMLVVDDDPEIAALLGRELRAMGYTVDAVGRADEALQAARGTDYALLVVDRGLPDGDGLDLVREVRRRRITGPVLMLTARRKVEERVIGLASGADDYLVKPFAVAEFRARVGALLRRPSRLRDSRLAVGSLMLDCEALEAVVDGHCLPLARMQFQLLELLVRRRNHITPKRMIEEALYGFDDDVSANAIEAHVSKLRQVLRDAGDPASIETRRGIGYRLVVSDDGAGVNDRETPGELLALIDSDGSFRARLRADHQALATLRTGMWALDRADLQGRLADIETLAHRLAGAAGTFGFDSIGAAATDLEERLIEVREGRARPGSRRRIEANLDVMTAALGDA